MRLCAVFDLALVQLCSVCMHRLLAQHDLLREDYCHINKHKSTRHIAESGVGTVCVHVQDKVDEVYKDEATWNRMSILSTAGSGFFSSDRTIQEYVDRVWKCEPCKVPDLAGK